MKGKTRRVEGTSENLKNFQEGKYKTKRWEIEDRVLVENCIQYKIRVSVGVPEKSNKNHNRKKAE